MISFVIKEWHPVRIALLLHYQSHLTGRLVHTPRTRNSSHWNTWRM